MILRVTSDLTHRRKGTEGTDGVPMDRRLPKISGRFLVVSYYDMAWRWQQKQGINRQKHVQNGYAKNTVLDDVGIFFILLCEMLWESVLDMVLSGKK